MVSAQVTHQFGKELEVNAINDNVFEVSAEKPKGRLRKLFSRKSEKSQGRAKATEETSVIVEDNDVTED